MSTVASIIGQLNRLIKAANATTGKSDPTATAAVNSLIRGYGEGPGEGPEVPPKDTLRIPLYVPMLQLTRGDPFPSKLQRSTANTLDVIE